MAIESRISEAWRRSGLDEAYQKVGRKGEKSPLLGVGGRDHGIVREAVYRHADGDVLLAAKTINTLNFDRTRNEANIGGMLEHPSIVKTYGYGENTSKGKAYILMQRFVEVREEQCPVASIRAVLYGLFTGLAHMHKQGVQHKDLAANITLGEDGFMIHDFGQSKIRTFRPSETQHSKDDLANALGKAAGFIDAAFGWTRDDTYTSFRDNLAAFASSSLVKNWENDSVPTENELSAQPLFQTS